MAKRGERRPWRVRYEWASGISGTETRGTRDAALELVRQLHGNADRLGERITITVTNRDTGQSWSGSHDGEVPA